YPYAAPNQVRCYDGDPSCDDDKTINGICHLRVTVCLNSTVGSSCTLSGVSQINVDHAIDNGKDPKFDPSFLAIKQSIGQLHFPVTPADTCTSQVIVAVPIKGPFGLGNNHCSKNKKRLKLHAVSQPSAGAMTDNDTLKLSCLPQTVNGCNPTKLYHSTLDRIQKQIFNQNCALGGCHDSQTQAGGLLLEEGAAYDNLVGHLPTNASAIAAGWLRVRAVTPGVLGDAETSFLFHKVEGDLPGLDQPDPPFGEPMPRDRPKLNGTLREIIRLWIDHGAPPDDVNAIWVPGTF